VLVPGAPLHWLVGAGDIAPFPTAAPVSPTGSPAATPLPTAAPAQLGPRAITLQNAAQITQTREITSPVFGPVSYSPDGKLLAVAVSRVIKLNDSSSLDEVRELTGHSGLVGTLAWSPDSATLASGAINDNIIRLWDPATARLLRTLEGHSGWIRSLAFSPDGKLLASGSTDMTVRLWDVATGKSLQTLAGHTDLLGGVAFSPDGKSLASGSRDGSVRVWDVATGRQREGFKFQAPFVQGSTTIREWMTGVAYSPDGKQLAAGSTDGIVRILDPDTGEERRQLTGHTGWIVIRGIVFSSDGKTLATASIDGTIRLWNPATGEQIAKLQGHRLQIIAISFSSDGKHLVSSSDEEGRILVWDVATKEAPQGLRVGQGVIASLVFAPDNNVLGAAGFNSEIRLFSLSDKRASSPLDGSRAAVQQTLAFLSDGRVVMLTDQDRISVFGAGEAQGKSLAGLDGTPLSVTVSRNGALIAAGSDSGAIVIWDAATGTARPALHGDLKAVARLAFNDDGSLLAAGGLPDDQGNVPIEVWDTAAGTKRQTLVGSQRQITAMSFQPGSAILAVADLQGALRLWNGQDGQLVRTISAQPQQERFVGIAFSPDGTVLATGSLNGDIQFWNPTTGDEAAKLNIGAGSVLALAFSPDGQKLAVGVRDVTVRVFELPAR
jgi:WD40 repeat protein